MKTLLLCLSLAFVGCGQNHEQKLAENRFDIVIFANHNWRLITDRDTGAQYLMRVNGGIIKLEKLPLESIK